MSAAAICEKWVGRLGLGFHPDTRGWDYSPALSDEWVAEYEADMETLFGLDGDPYGFALAAMEKVIDQNSQVESDPYGMHEERRRHP